MNEYTLSTRSNGDGSEPCYVVYFNREIIAIFPIIDPASHSGGRNAMQFIAAMEGV